MTTRAGDEKEIRFDDVMRAQSDIERGEKDEVNFRGRAGIGQEREDAPGNELEIRCRRGVSTILPFRIS